MNCARTPSTGPYQRFQMLFSCMFWKREHEACNSYNEIEAEREVLLPLNTSGAIQLEHVAAHRHAHSSELRLDAYSHREHCTDTLEWYRAFSLCTTMGPL